MKFDHAAALKELVVLTFILIVVNAMMGCTSEQARRVASTVEVRAGHGTSDTDNAKGGRLLDSDFDYIEVGIRPLAGLEPPQHFVIDNMPQPRTEYPVERPPTCQTEPPRAGGVELVGPTGTAANPGGLAAGPPPEPKPESHVVGFSLFGVLIALLLWAAAHPDSFRKALGHAWSLLGRFLAWMKPSKAKVKK